MGSFARLAALCLCLQALPTLSILAEDFSAFPATEYDFVIVGGGTAGSVMASRLTENPAFKVLLIEAGPRYDGNLDLEVPGYGNKLYGSQFDWGYFSTPQVGLNNRVDYIAKGRVLGGSSAINGMQYTRGSANDWDRYARVTKDAGWSWDKILPYFLKSERWFKPAGLDVAGKFNPAFHSEKGLLGTSLSSFPQAAEAKLLAASKEPGSGLKYNQEMNDGNPLGLGWTQSTIANGTRSSAASAYLGPSQISRSNLHVLVNHRATQLFPNRSPGSDGRKPSFQTVAFRPQSGMGSAVNVTATKEVILSGGTYETPHILLGSGIGDAGYLRSVGIEPKVDLPSVGRNLSDHVVVGYTWQLGVENVIDPLANATLQEELLAQWQKDRTGALSSYGVNFLAFSRLPERWPSWSKFKDPAAGKDTPHYEYVFPGSGLYPRPGPTLTVYNVLVSPSSRGSVTLNATDPFAPPLIDSRLLESEFDILTLREGGKALKKLMSARTWADWKLTLTGTAGEAKTDADLEQYIRSTAGHGLHVVGTAAMSPPNADYGVVDPDLKVKKVTGLRVVDASIFPYIPAAHTQAAVYAAAERAADLVKAAWKGS